MRTAIFLGLHAIARAINPEYMKNISEDVIGFIAILFIGIIVLDIVKSV